MISRSWRKAAIAERRSKLRQALVEADSIPVDTLAAAMAASECNPGQLALSDQMVENAFGNQAIPLGLATGFLIDGQALEIPMATEEPSVIAAASFMGGQISRHGGLATQAGPPLIGSTIFIENASPQAGPTILANAQTLEKRLKALLASMTARGGGFRGIRVESLANLPVLKVSVDIDTRDAMGANLANSCAEALRGDLEALSGGQVLMAILSNQAEGRLTKASFRFPVGQLSRAGFSGQEMARRIILANEIAKADPGRAVTHNKGIMNGISALALATGNDTRAIEAAAHAWAARGGSYQALSTYRIDGSDVLGELEMPLPFGCVGGAVSALPVAQLSLAILGRPDAVGLSRIAAALGLAQNFAALNALVGEGIQAGHMPLHARRMQAGQI